MGAPRDVCCCIRRARGGGPPAAPLDFETEHDLAHETTREAPGLIISLRSCHVRYLQCSLSSLFFFSFSLHHLPSSFGRAVVVAVSPLIS